MYFIVYITQSRSNVVVPYSWVSGIDSVVEHLVNFGMDSSHKFKVFWSKKPEALDNDGIPIATYGPYGTFQRPENLFPAEGWYECQIRRFRLNYNDALQYSNKRREVPPVVYNDRKLLRKKRASKRGGKRPNQRPTSHQKLSAFFGSALPTTQSQQTSSNQSDPLPSTSQHTDPLPSTLNSGASSSLATVQLAPASGSVDTTNESEGTPVSHDPSHDLGGDHMDSNSEIGLKPEPDSIVNNSLENADQLRLLFDSNQSSSQNNGTSRDAANENSHAVTNQVLHLEIARTGTVSSVVDDDDDDPDACQILGPETPLPIQTTANGMVKREGDYISADFSFNVTKRGRIYCIGGRYIEFNADVLEKLEFWNKNQNTAEKDFTFGLAVILSILAPDDLSSGRFEVEAIDFLTFLMRVRTQNDEHRIEAVLQQIRSYLTERKSANNASATTSTNPN